MPRARRVGFTGQRCLPMRNRGSYSRVAGKHDSHLGEEESKQKLRTAIEANIPTFNRSKAQLLKPAPLAFDDDSKFELVPVYPRNSPTAGKGSNPAATEDELLGK